MTAIGAVDSLFSIWGVNLRQPPAGGWPAARPPFAFPPRRP
jgi:hypothetical protein